MKDVVKEEEETTKDEKQLKEEEDLMQYPIGMIEKVKYEKFEGDNSKFSIEKTWKRHQSVSHIFEKKYEAKWRGHSNVLNIFLKMYVEAERSDSLISLMQEEVQLQVCDNNSMFQQQVKLNKIIEEI